MSTSVRMLAPTLLCAVVVGCADPAVTPTQPAADEATSPTPLAGTPAPTRQPGGAADPVGVMALGHSGLTGESSDPAQPGVEVRANSWATGTNPEVQSIYRRLVNERADTEGKFVNAAEPGAPASRLAAQARAALTEVPAPELVLIQAIDGDIRCDGTDADHIAEFGAAVAEALTVIVDASPMSRILIVSQMGRPATYAEAVSAEPAAWSQFAGDGLCDFFTSDGQIDEESLAALTEIIEGYEAEQQRVCASFEQCSDDGGVFSQAADHLRHWAPGDWNHLSLEGHARAAEILWPRVQELLGLVARSDPLEGTFDVGGHSLYLKCTGTGSPTILYFHGWIEDPATRPAANAEAIRSGIDDAYRFCAYDRRNVGRSDTIDAAQRPEDMLGDIESLLDEAGVDGPYVLLGASFGGIPAYLFANRHPDDVIGMVLLDAMFPDDLTLDPLWPEDERYVSLDEEDECCTLERISHYQALVAASKHIGEEPDIPLIYLASEEEGLTVDGPPEYTDVAPGVLQDYVDRFSPGTLVTVDSPHFMEVAIPDRIVDALREVIALAGP